MVYREDFLKDLYYAENLIWDYLQQGTRNKKSKFNCPTLSTCSGSKVLARTVILRKINKEKKLLFFYTDLRSKKILDIKKNSNSVIHIYDEKKKLQVQLYGYCKIERDKNYIKKIWDSLSEFSKRNYQSRKKPGTILKSSSENISNIEKNDSHLNFGIIKMKIKKIEILHLFQNNNKRAIIEYKKNTITERIVP